MPSSVPRTPVDLNQLKAGDLVVAYEDDDARENNDAVLNGVILLTHKNSREGSWDVTYRDGSREASGLVNLSDRKIYLISAGVWTIGHQGPWSR